MNGHHGGGDGRHSGGGRGDGGRGRPAQRRMPPPDATGDEAAYLAKVREERTPMVVELMDGEVVRGWVEYYDRDMIKINRNQGPNVFIRKRHIRYLYEEE